MIQPGEVFWADTAYGRRPAIVISREQLNRGNTVIVVMCTTANLVIRSAIPNCVPFAAGEYGFTKDCVAQAETVQMIEKQYIDPGPIGILTDEKLREVIRAVGYVMDADCEPT
jgi:mRNA-degrading endonuclease toxin of MazEF toxin-antitoxin module